MTDEQPQAATEDETDGTTSERSSDPVSTATPRSARRTIWIVGALTLVAGLVIGGLVATLVAGADDDAEPDCDEAVEVVNASIDTITSINESEVQDGSFFSALVAEQRTITFAMADRPSCFSLQERASAAGLLDGLNGLIEAGVSSAAPPVELPVEQPPVEPVPDETAPDGSAPAEE